MSLLSNGDFDGNEAPWGIFAALWKPTGGRTTPGVIELYPSGGSIALGIDAEPGYIYQYIVPAVHRPLKGKLIQVIIWAKKLTPITVTLEGSIAEGGDPPTSIGIRSTLSTTTWTQIVFDDYIPTTTETLTLNIVARVSLDEQYTTVYLDDAFGQLLTPYRGLQYYPPQNGPLPYPTFQSWDKDDILGTLVRRDRVRRDEDDLVRSVTDLGKRDRGNILKDLELPTERTFEEL